MDSTQNSACNKIAKSVVPGERLLWCGQPVVRIRSFQWPALIVLTLAVVATVLLVLDQTEFLVVPVILFGVLSWLWLRWDGVLRRMFMAYGITDRRVIVVKLHSEYAIPFAMLKNLYLTRHRGGLGTISAFTEVPLLKSAKKVPVSRERALFRRVNDADQVYETLLYAMNARGMTVKRRHLRS